MENNVLGFKKVERTFNPPSGERLFFKITNNGNAKWKDLTLDTKMDAINFLDACIEDLKKMRGEIICLPYK